MLNLVRTKAPGNSLELLKTGKQRMKSYPPKVNLVNVTLFIVISLMLAFPHLSRAAETLCAEVKIEISQELTLERQAFDAHMRINNGLANISLKNVQIVVNFKDEDGNPVFASFDADADPDTTGARFFISVDSMQNIDDIEGQGTIDPATSADIHWLIIPVPGAAEGHARGKLYYVGATLTYAIGGEENVTEVTPDYIFVKPLPEISLDYFIPTDVYGDDPNTGAIEPVVPFSLGLRVKNIGSGTVKSLKIDSAQPKIVENKQGLLIGFAIEGSEVNGNPASDSLLVDFGDIGPGLTGAARWIMTSSLSGRFIEFDARVSHSDELGGELTSLIKSENTYTHFLVRDVLVDMPGRDQIRDFLARDGDIFRVYETDSDDTVVADVSEESALNFSGLEGTLTTPTPAGFIYVSLTDPFRGEKALTGAVRSDGKRIKADNVWLYKRMKGDNWAYFVNLFDVDTTGSYTVQFEETGPLPQPPVIQYVADQTVSEGAQLSFIVAADDPNGTIPVLSAGSLPVGAEFSDQLNGTGNFDWVPLEGQAGDYEIVFNASDGALTASRRVSLTVKGFEDTDGDDLDDEWETLYFGNLARDGSGDYDRDGISDLDEFLNETDPAALADLAVRQVVDNINSSVGDIVTLTVTATNNGSRDAAGVEVFYPLSDGLIHINDNAGDSYNRQSGIWFVGSLPASAAATLTISAKVRRSGNILKLATLTGADLYDPDRSNNSAALLLNGVTQSDLALALTSDDLTPEAGEILTVALNVTNNGVDDATGVRIEELLPGNLSYVSGTASSGSYDQNSGIWDVGNLASGAGAELLLTLTSNTAVETVLTAALIAGDQSDPDPTNNRASIVINQNPGVHPVIANLAVHKLSDLSAVDVSGQAVFTLLVRNNGPDDAANIEIADLLADGLKLQLASPTQGTYDDQSKRWQVGIVPAGALAIMDMTVDVTQAGAQDNTASIVSHNAFDPDNVNDAETTSVAGLAVDISVTQTVDPAIANPGENFEVTITVTNHGPHAATGVVVVGEAPAVLIYQSHTPSQGVYDRTTGQWTFGDLTRDESATLVVTYRAETAGTMIMQAGLLSSSPPDTDDTNDQAQVTVVGNAAPAVAEIPNLTIEEGTGSATINLDAYVTDGNHVDSEISWSYGDPGPLDVWIDDDRVAHIEVPHLDWNGTQAITFTATDPLELSNEGQVLFTVSAVNDAPVNTVPGEQTTAEDTGLTIAPSISIADIDADSSDLRVTLSATHGTLILAETNGLTFSAGSGTADTNLTFSGAVAAINTALNGMRYEPDQDFFGSALITIHTDDQGFSGSGGPQTDTDTVNVDISAVNDAPTAALNQVFGGSEGQSITFTASAADIESTALTYDWDFDYNGEFVADASGTDLSAPEWTYADNGTYTVALRVQDAEDAASEIVVAQVTVADREPTAAFNRPPGTLYEGSPVVFTDVSISAPDDITAWRWDFGDGQTSDDQNPEYTFFNNGEYTVRLKVTDDDGSTNEVQHQVTIANVAPMVAAGADRTANEGAEVSFDGSFSDASPTDTHTYAWNFGDGSAEVTNSLAPSHSYADNGVYTVTLTVKDGDGGVGADTLTVTVDNVAPSTEAGPDATINEGGNFTSSGSFIDPGVDTWKATVDYGDGSGVQALALDKDKSFALSHTYTANDNYTVTVTISDSDGESGTDKATVTVNNVAPTADAGSDATINEGGTFTSAGSFTDPGADTWTATADYGDGSGVQVLALNPDKRFALSHTYTKNSIYTVTVTISDSDGESGTDTATVTVNNVAPTANAGSDATINEGGTFASSGSFTDPGADEWTATVDYGEGSGAQALALNPDKSFALDHSYTQNGTYTVAVAISDGDGASDSDTAIVTVKNVIPTADAGSDATINEGDTFASSGSFTDPGADTWTATVDYGDGSDAQALTLDDDKSFALSHTYTKNGTYTVAVAIKDSDDESGTDTATVTVNNVAPIADAGTDATINEGGTFISTGSFTDPGADTWTATVDYGEDSGTQALALAVDKGFDLSHTYAENGTYTVAVTITDSDGESGTDTVTVTVNNVAPTADAGTDATINEGDTFISSGSFTDPGADTWTASVVYGDVSGIRTLLLNPDKSFALNHTYAQNGTYTVTVTISDSDGESGTDTATVTVNNVAPTANAGSDATINEGDTFTSSGSFTDPGADTWTAAVDYGDGSDIQTLVLNPDKRFELSHTYTKNGDYTVAVTIKDSDGESGTDTATVTVNNVAPTADAGIDATIDEGDTFASSGSFTDPGADTWTATVDYGDGSGVQALALNPDKSFSLNHTYANNLDYTVTVTISDSDGESGTDTATVTVNNVAPTTDAGSDATIDEGGTFASSGSFTDPGADTWTATVDYGDGSGVEALALNPDKRFSLSHTYANNLDYTVTVTISDSDGESGNDTATVTVKNVVPTADAGSDATLNEGDTFASSGSFTDPGADTWTASVDYGDGSGVQALNLNPDKSFSLNHTYAENGSYLVAVTVKDSDGESGTDTATVAVNNVAPTTDAGSDATINEGDTFTSSGSFTDPGADTWTATVDYGEGSGVQPLALNPDKRFALSHTYTENGDYTVAVTIKDSDGESGTDTATVTVNNVAPTADAGSDTTINEGDTFISSGWFTDPGADTWTATVDYGDGSDTQALALDEDKNFALSHTYGESGSYTVTVTVTDDDGGVGIDTLTVAVANVAPSVDAGADQAADEGSVVSFSGSFTDPGADIWTATVDYGDSTGVEPLSLNLDKRYASSHTYGDNGIYTVTVTVTDDDGGVGTDTLTVTVANVAPVITDLTNDNPSTGEVHLTASFMDPGWLDSHSSQWDFGDGSLTEIYVEEENQTSAVNGNMAAVHYYAAEGLFTVTVTVTDDDGAECEPRAMDVLIDKTPPVIDVFEPQTGYYRNTDEIKVDLTVTDPDSGGVSSGLVANSVVVILDDQPIAADALLDLSRLADGEHTLYVAASDYAGNSVEQAVRFEVGPVPAQVHVHPHNWSLKWLDPFDHPDGRNSKDTVKAEIGIENAEIEIIIPTDKSARLKPGDGYGDYVVADVAVDQKGGKPGKGKVVSLTLRYAGVGEVDILAFSGETVQDYFSVNTGDLIVIDGSPSGHLGRRTVLFVYQSDPPQLSAAHIIPETVLLNGQVPINKGSALLKIKDASALAQTGVIVEPPYGFVREKKHHVWLANVGQPRQMTLTVGARTIFADEPYPFNWQDWFSLDTEGQLQMMRIRVSGKDNLLKVLHHNLQAEARIYLDGALALTILPETRLVAMEVLFNRFEVMSTLESQDLERGGDWLVTAHNGATLKGKHPRKHIRISDIGHPQKAKLVIGDTVVFDDLPFPIKWSERYVIVDAQRQDMSIKTHGARGNNPHLDINCKKLTREARLYLDDTLVLLISPPPEIAVSITGELELDGDPATFDGSFHGLDAIELKGKLPKDVDPAMSYEPINTSGEPDLHIGDRKGDFEVVDFTAGFADYRVTELFLRYIGSIGTEINLYEDSRRKHPVSSYPVFPGEDVLVDVNHLAGNRVYLEIGQDRAAIDLTGNKAVATGDSILNCMVIDTFESPLGPPHYFDLTLRYVGGKDLIALTAYDGRQKDVIGTYQVDTAVDPVFTVTGSLLPRGHLGENLVLEYAPIE